MILTINAGSSSVKFALYQNSKNPVKVFFGELKRIGLPECEISFSHMISIEKRMVALDASDYSAAIDILLNELDSQIDFAVITCIAHRVVHGMKQTDPVFVSDELLRYLKEIVSIDPEHLPNEIKIIDAIAKRHPGVVQAACFDTAFHCTIPRTTQLLPIPRKFYDMGVHRYGFHGISYSYIMHVLSGSENEVSGNARIVIAHLGNGASLAAIRNGNSFDTTMAFTPASGIPMSSRSGDIDPGVAVHVMKTEELSAEQFNHMMNHGSGLLGISGTSGDMSDLLAQRSVDPRSADAIDCFCYAVKKQIGAFAAALGGIDTLVFSGGIGENAPAVRSGICEGLSFLGVDIDENKNVASERTISNGDARVKVMVIPTDEQWMMAYIVNGLMKT